MRRSNTSPFFTLAGSVIVIVFLTIAPWIVPSEWASVLLNFFILVIMATMWNLLAGYAGMVSIGQQAFIGLGSYATLYFALKGVNPFLTIPLATIVCAVLAVPITYLLLRLRGGYFSIATWVVSDTALLIIGAIALLRRRYRKLMPGPAVSEPFADGALHLFGDVARGPRGRRRHLPPLAQSPRTGAGVDTRQRVGRTQRRRERAGGTPMDLHRRRGGLRGGRRWSSRSASPSSSRRACSISNGSPG